MNSAIGRRVKSAREAAGINQAECAQKAGISQPYLANIELGVKNPSANVLRRLASATNVAFAWLLDNVREETGAYDGDQRLAVQKDQLAAPGLRDLAEDEPMCHALDISGDEWVALRSLVMSNPPDKDGYLLLLYAVRTASRAKRERDENVTRSGHVGAA